METVKIKLTVAFDGTRYVGWQLQKSDQSIQQKLEEAFEVLFHRRLRVHGSSRTDSGAHAEGMVAHVGMPAGEMTIPLSRLPLALNAHLPKDIRVFSAEECPGEFHARFQAKGKQYRYFIWNHPVAHPLLRHFTWHCRQPLDVRAMRAAADRLRGCHDFQAFAGNPGRPMESTVRTVHRCRIRRMGTLLMVVIDGDGFLYKMCRGMVGTLVEVGLGRLSVEDIPRILASGDRGMAGSTAPARGLVLWKVWY